MKDKIISTLISSLMSVLMGMLSGDELKKFADFLLDQVEDYAQKTGTKLDDTMVLPICGLIRKVFSIPEFDS